MPNIRSAKKRLRQNKKRRLRNKSVKSYLKTITKNVKNAKEKNEATDLLKEAYKAYDMAVSKGVIHKNNAARHKSRLTRFINKKFSVSEKSQEPTLQPETSS
ncbi:MAG: 30S ribosomal protein S20 [Candidatus Cloacimonadota bacterium]|nr:MAG: 30S ribosomal protein S20 [Candidatus Cloacimonadota bacterium]